MSAMNPKISVSIMAHPSRRDNVELLRYRLGGEVPVAWASNAKPSAHPPQRWATGKRAWQLHDKDADWHVVIQDDAIVCEDFREAMSRALAHRGNAGVVSAYTGTGRPRQMRVRYKLARAEADGSSWWSTTEPLYWGVAVALPVSVIPKMVHWCSNSARRMYNYDTRIGEYARLRDWRTWYTVPSLVDHLDEGSLVGHGPDRNDKSRRAHNYVGDSSALAIDWSR